MAQESRGTVLKREAVLNSGTFVAVGGFRNFNLPFNLETNDITDLADTWRKNKPSLNQIGDITGEIFFDPADAQHNESQGVLKNLLQSDQRNFRLVAATGWYVQMLCSVPSFVITGSTGEQYTANITLRPSGAPTFGDETP